MKKMILFFAILAMPFVGMSQEDNPLRLNDERTEISSVNEINPLAIAEINIDDVVFTYYRKFELISDDPFLQIEMFETEKSFNIISTKAYIKSLQMKRRASLMS